MLKNLEILRIEKGYSQRELAKVSGVSQATISLIEKEGRQARPAAMKKIADALGIGIFEIAEFAQRPKSLAA